MMTLSSNNGMKGMYLTEREAAEMAARAKTTGSTSGGAPSEDEGGAAFTMIAPTGARNHEQPQKTDWNALGSGRSLGTSTGSSGPSPQPETDDPELAAALAASLNEVKIPAPADEPAASGPRVTTVQVRLPTGKRWTRRFSLDTNTLGDLFSWMEWQSLEDSKTAGGNMPLLTSLGGYHVLKQGFGSSRRKFHRVPVTQKITLSGEAAEIECTPLGESTCLNVFYMFKKLFGSSSTKKKKREGSSPAPAPVALKKPKLAPKPSEGAVQGERSSAYLEKKKSKQACATCGSTEF
ncbi:Ataxin 3, partial [Perkinsus olseni]